MKIRFIYIGWLIVWLMVSCDSTVLEFPKNGGVDPTLVHVNLTFEVDPTIEPYTTTQALVRSSSDISPFFKAGIRDWYVQPQLTSHPFLRANAADSAAFFVTL